MSLLGSSVYGVPVLSGRLRAHGILAASVLMLSCSEGGGDPLEPEAGPPAALAIVAGSDQPGEAGGTLSQALVVLVTDADGRSVSGAAVTWSTADGSLSAATSATDEDGHASVTWTLAPRVATQTATATVVGLEPVSFEATAGVPVSAQVEAIAGDDQEGPAEALLPSPLVLRVTTASGQPITGAPVTWTTTQGVVVPADSVTDTSGQVSATWSLSSAVGQQTATATVSGRPPVTFSAIGTLPGTASVLKNAGDLQTAEAGAPLSSALVVLVRTASGAPIAGAQVLWTADAGSLGASTSTTDAAGRASVTWTMPLQLGAHSATAAVADLPPAVFTATAELPATARIEKVAGDAQNDTVAAALAEPLVVSVLNAGGQPLANVPVVWTVLTGAGTVDGAGNTDVQGRASAKWHLGTSAGTQQIQALVDGLNPVAFTAEAAAGTASAIRFSTDSVVIGTWGDSARLSAEVLDQFGNPRAGDAVAWRSADTLVARVDVAGWVSSRRAGSAEIVATSGAASGAARALVRLQLNSQCRIPSDTPARGAVGPAPTFEYVPGAFKTAPIGREVTMREPIPLDYDADGDEDLIVFFFQKEWVDPYVGGLAVWRNDDGTFVTANHDSVFGTSFINTDAPRQFEIADFNGDGRTDIFAAQHGFDAEPFPGATNLLLLSHGTNEMRDASATNLSPNDVAYSHGSASGDWDCDGDVDLVVTNSAYNHFNRLYINDGAGHFTAEDSRLPATLGQYPNTGFSAVGCDFDNDGDQDIYWGGMTRRPPFFLINDGFGRFRFAPADIRVPDSGYGRKEDVAESRCADLDLDGWPDLVIGSDGFDNNGLGSYGVFINRGNWDFEDATARLIPTGWESPNDWYWRMRPIDMNGDGWLDLLPATNQGNDVMLLNQGPDAPFAVVQLPTGYSRYVDYNRDGRPDIIRPGWWSGGNEGLPDLWENR